MSDDQRASRYGSFRPQHLQAIDLDGIYIHPATPETGSNVTLTDIALDKEGAQPNTSDGGKTAETLSAKFRPFWRTETPPLRLRWIYANWSWMKWVPVLRSALIAWISLVFFLIPSTLNVMGEAAFLIIIAAFLSPSSEPFVLMLQRELGILLFATSGWAWSCLGIKLADLARSNKDPTASSAAILTGQYMEAGPSAILAVFLFLGSFFFLYIKSRMPPGPVTFAYHFNSMLCMDMSLTIAALYPYPNYMIGQLVILPLTFHAAITLLLSLCLFPTSASTTFNMRLRDVLSSLLSATREHYQHLQQDVTAFGFSPSPIVAAVNKAESSLAALSSAAGLQKFDIIYSRFAPIDYTHLHCLARGLVMKASGMSVYYTLIDPTREKFPVTPIASIPVTPAFSSPFPSRSPSPNYDSPPAATVRSNDRGSPNDWARMHRYHSAPSLRRQRSASQHRKRSPLPLKQTHSHQASPSLLHVALSRATRTQPAVGVFESLNYLNLEATHMSPAPNASVERSNELLSDSCQDLLKSCERGLQATSDWLSSIDANSNFFTFWMSRENKHDRVDRIKKFEGIHRGLSWHLDEFTNRKRFTVLDPYRAMFNCADDTMTECDIPSYRHLFYSYVYQYHLMRYATSIRDVLSEIIRLETEREKPSVWFPTMQWSNLTCSTTWESAYMMERDDDENPDMIPGLEPTSLTDLGQAVPRDPDTLPPENAMERFVNSMCRFVEGLGGGNALFALKASIMTIILALPSFLKPSAEFAYKNKFVWAVIMSQLTVARFRGETTFQLLSRILSTAVGGIIGTVMWYISTGSGQGNAFGAAAVCFVCFPIFFFFRLYWPVPPMINLIIWVTTALCFGYSWQDTHLPSASSPGFGFDVAWRRFVLVVVGVMSAGISSFFPPATTIRLYQRKTLATVTEQIGTMYCSAISFATTKREGEAGLIVQQLVAVLNKLKGSVMLKENAVYEISLRGKWPAERYQRILESLIQISNLLSQLTSVLEQMEPKWTQAFLKRTRLSDAGFQGDVLAIISLISSSLRTGKPLPQVTPCPLLNRFMERNPGLNVVHGESEEDFGLPKMLTEETLESLQYMNFCVGVSTMFSIVTRLDKLMIAAKELVGEQYHIDGVGLPLHYRRGRGVPMRSPAQTLT